MQKNKLKINERQRWKKRVELGKNYKTGNLSRRDQKAKTVLWV